MENIATTHLRPELTRIVATVESGNPVAVTKLNLPKLVMVPVDFYERAVKALDDQAPRTALRDSRGRDLHCHPPEVEAAE